ncbi:MAG: FUR family transcriptional regulator [Parcubacteria group bacterium Licking1014_1]|nr:MAG: FUR family transcriptional regulator [Parcubacteria group bacterium Licking1014_1]
MTKDNFLTTERMTSQKQIILNYLRNTKSHPSAQKIYIDIKRVLPRISQGTVYRILNSLKKKGEVQEISTKDITFFDGDLSDHSHFICQGCSSVFDIFDECSKCDIIKNKKTKVGKINNYRIYFYGICKDCRKK